MTNPPDSQLPQGRRAGRVHELWRADYVKDAYRDQTGKSHWGYIVHDRCVVQETGETFPMDDGYGGHYPDAGRVALNPLTGDEFRYRPNLIDYFGGGSWKNETTGEFWNRVPINPQGYVHPDGSPVTPVFS